MYYHSPGDEERKRGKSNSFLVFVLLKEEGSHCRRCSLLQIQWGGPRGRAPPGVRSFWWCWSQHFVFALWETSKKKDRLSHVYKIQGSYFLFFAKNDPLGLERPSGLNRKSKWAISQKPGWYTYKQLSVPIRTLYLLRKMSHCDVLSQYFNYGSMGWHVTCCSLTFIILFPCFEYICPWNNLLFGSL